MIEDRADAIFSLVATALMIAGWLVPRAAAAYRARILARGSGPTNDRRRGPQVQRCLPASRGPAADFRQVRRPGRLWTIQYLQYPNPAGLKRVKVDRWSRTVYDRVPEPPPHGPRGADRITILEDTDGDGRADKFQDFVDGLNLCTGVDFGHGGVFVLQVPYLLFYPDSNRDDVPDGDPEVLAHRVRHGRRPVAGQSSDLGTRRLAVRRQRQHDDLQYPRHRISAGRVAISPGDARVRIVLRRGRQYVTA